MNIEYVHVFSPYSQHVAERVAEVLAGKQVDGEVEGGVDDHEELHGLTLVCMIQIHDIVSPSEMEAIKQKTGNTMKVK